MDGPSIRLHGIDAPELHQHGDKAKAAEQMAHPAEKLRRSDGAT
jgi:endonuclease YncB( thermonuclease family)